MAQIDDLITQIRALEEKARVAYDRMKCGVYSAGVGAKSHDRSAWASSRA